MTKIAFVTNACPPYRIRTFEMLAEHHDIDFYFYSNGGERYWQQQMGIHTGQFRHEYLAGWQFGQTRVAPQLVSRLLAKDYDLYIKCINGKFALPTTYTIARARRKPFVLWTGVWNRIDTPLQKLFFPVVRQIYQGANSIVTYGSHVNNYLISEGIAPEKIFASRHAVDNNKYNRPISPAEISKFRSQIGVADHEKIVLYIGRLEGLKGVNHLIQAFAKMDYQDTVLVVAGTGSQANDFKTLAESLGIAEKVRFIGYVDKEMTPICFACAWTMVLPSVTTNTFKEPWGLVVNEAFNQGTPVIATDSVGAAAGGLVQDGKTGFVVPERNEDALAQAMVMMLTNDRLRMEMSAAASERIKQWSNQEMVEDFGKAIEYALTANSRGILTPNAHL